MNHPESVAFHNKLAEDKRIGREDARNYIKERGIDAAKKRASAERLPAEEATQNYGYWAGWIDACLDYRGN